MNHNQSQKMKRIVSGMLSLTMITSMSTILPANAETVSSLALDGFAVNNYGYTNVEGIVSDDVVTDIEGTGITIKGDVNSDGKITDDDRELLNKWLTRSIGDNELDLKNADVNYDGKVNTQDLVELSRLCKKTTSEQTIVVDSEALSEINTEDNAFKLSVNISAAGDAQTLLSADESRYSSAIKSDMVVGVVPELEYEEGYAVDEVTLNFNIKDDYIENTDGEYAAVSEDFKGIKRYNVFKYFEDIDMLLPIETNYDTESNTVTTTVDELGTYCLVDMEKWFETLGIKPEELANANTAPSSVSMVGTSETTAVQSDSESTADAPIDVVFHAFEKGSAEEDVENAIMDTATRLFDKYGRNGNVHIFVASYTGVLPALMDGRIYATNEDELDHILKILNPINDSIQTDDLNYKRYVDKLMKNCNGVLMENSDRYYVFVENMRVEATSGEKIDIAEYLKEKRMKAVVLSNYEGDYDYIANATGGARIERISNFGEPTADYIISKHGDGKPKYTVLVPTGWKEIEIDTKKITNEYKTVIEDNTQADKYDFTDKTKYPDTDEDGLIDLAEIRYSFNKEDVIKWDSNGDVILPTIKECMSLKAGKDYVKNSLSDYGFWDWGRLNDIKVLPLYSDPTVKDTDGDDFEDGKETLLQRMKYNTITIDDHLLDDSGSINGNNPEITRDDLNKMIDHVRMQMARVDGGYDCVKNQLLFTRTRKKGISDARFMLTPLKNSDFAFTVSDTKETNFGEGFTTDDYNSTVRISYKNGNRKVTPVEINPSNDGTSITYVFALEAGTEYSIKVNNPTNNHEGEYSILVSEDNWVYAPNGGYREYSNTAYTESRFAYSFREDYMQDEVVFDLFKKMLGTTDGEGFGWTDETIEEHYPTVEKFFTNRKAKTEQERITLCRKELNRYGTDFVYQALNSGIEKQNEIVDVLSNADTGLGYFTMIVDDMPVLGIISNALSISLDLYSLYQGNQKEQLTDAILDGRFNIVLYSNYQPSTSYYQKNGYKAWKTKYFNKYETIPYGPYNEQYVRCEYTKYTNAFLFENEE